MRQSGIEADQDRGIVSFVPIVFSRVVSGTRFIRTCANPRRRAALDFCVVDGNYWEAPEVHETRLQIRDPITIPAIVGQKPATTNVCDNVMRRAKSVLGRRLIG
jgi:hypothetical protein